jgi:uncharacterized protein (TIGR00251 family)
MVATVIRVKVKPNARTASFVQSPDGSWLAKVSAPAREGKANRELIELIARHFGCAKSAVSIRRGASARTKVVRVEVS